ITMSLVFFHVRTTGQPSVSTPPPATNIEKLTQQQVDNAASRLPFTPLTPTSYPNVVALQSAQVRTFCDGTKYLDVYWTLKAPLQSLHMREVKGSLADRAHCDVVEKQPDPGLTWMLPDQSQWLPMLNSTGKSTRLIVGADFKGFSVTLDVGVMGG